MCSYDRLARSSKQLFESAERFDREGVSLVSLKEGTNMPPQGRLFFAMCAAMAQSEREAYQRAPSRGYSGGEGARAQVRKAVNRPQKMDTALRLYRDGGCPLSKFASARALPAPRSTALSRIRAFPEGSDTIRLPIADKADKSRADVRGFCFIRAILSRFKALSHLPCVLKRTTPQRAEKRYHKAAFTMILHFNTAN